MAEIEVTWVPSTLLPQSVIQEFEEGIQSTGVELRHATYGKESCTVGVTSNHHHDPKRARRSRPIVEETSG